MAVLLYSLSVPTIIALCCTRVVAKGLRMFLISALVSGILINTSSILIGLIVLVTVLSGAQPPTPLFCRFLIWEYNIGQVSRCFSIVGFSIMVLAVVQYGHKNMKVMYILSLCIVWGILTSYHAIYQVPQVYGVKFTVGSVCLPVHDETIFIEARIFSLCLCHHYHIHLSSCVYSCVTNHNYLCYLKMHITGDINCGRAVTKLGLFPLTGNLVNSISCMQFLHTSLVNLEHLQ